MVATSGSCNSTASGAVPGLRTVDQTPRGGGTPTDSHTDMPRLECRRSVETATSEVKSANVRKKALEGELALAKASVRRWGHLRKREGALTAQLRAIAGDISSPVGLSGFSPARLNRRDLILWPFLTN